MKNQSPVILIHGIFGFGPKELGPLSYWGAGLRVQSPLARHEASVGPLGSAHDRACELAAQIKGTRVDYGAEHAQEQGHERFGRDYTGKGFVPDWGSSQPVHLVGHSLGSPTIRCLQNLLERDYWGWGSDHRWVRSISTISGVSNGSTLTYFFGADEKTGLLPAQGVAAKLVPMIELYMFVTHALQDRIYNFDLEYWNLTRRTEESLSGYLGRVATSVFLRGTDNACYSLSLQGAFADNAAWQTFPDTFYFSYVTANTFAAFNGKHLPNPAMGPALFPLATYIGQREFAAPPIPTSSFKASDWWENDGMVSTYSQLYPRISGNHPVGGEMHHTTPSAEIQPGKWYYQWARNVDHLQVTLAPGLHQHSWQEHFYQNLFNRLAEVG